MIKPQPREVFDAPSNYWSFLTTPSDNDFEGQHFDRKQAGLIDPTGTTTASQVQNVVKEIKTTISAFSNSNVEGGLLVIGIASNGSVKGIKHLTEPQLNSVTNFNVLLSNQSAESRLWACTDETGAVNSILLIYVPYTEYAICETPGRIPESWTRNGPQNVPLTQMSRDQLKRRKKIVDFEMSYCTDFDIADIDKDVLGQFRHEFLPETAHQLSDTELLYQAGALIKISDGKYALSKAGLLFFAANPQRALAGTHIRLLRFNVSYAEKHNRGLPTFERNFTGSLTKQIRDTRTFFKDSGFFKIYQFRKAEGGFQEEPEYPPIAIDEAIVNAVVHRDYATGIPIECEAYKDAFIVRNPGRMIQRDADLPDEFSLTDHVLNSTPRNPKLLEWLRIMKDPNGRSFVMAISEGTKRMSQEMMVLNLPAPSYYLSDNQTLLKLISNAEVRETAILSVGQASSTEFTNLYRLDFKQGGQSVSLDKSKLRYKEFLVTLRDVLTARGWYIDRFSFGRIICHERGKSLTVPGPVAAMLRIYPAYELQVRDYLSNHYLCIDYTVQVQNICTADKVLQILRPTDLVDRRCVADSNGWQEGRIISCDTQWTKVRLFASNTDVSLLSKSVIPDLPIRLLEAILKQKKINFDLHQAIKKYSLASQKAASRERAEKIASWVDYASSSLFPVVFGDFEVTVNKQPVNLIVNGVTNQSAFIVQRLPEPLVEFREHRSSPDVRDGITQFGIYDTKRHAIELVPICARPHQQQMEQLIERLKVGKFKYRGAERTFSTRFTYSSIITVEHILTIEKEVKRLLTEHTDWVGNSSLNRIFLVQTPEQGYTSDDESSPYYTVKRLLLEQGIPCQMIDTPTLLNPDWKDLNLALNLTAKCGVTPWVLPDAIPEADFFIGLSYTESRDRQRVMGFANVFNQYGKWEFYSGNTAFDYAARVEHFAKLVQTTLQRLSLSQTPNIVFHYSTKFSREDRLAIHKAATSVRPLGTYTFVSINPHHNVRFFDSRPETDGSLRRGSYILTSPCQIFLSTTGYNPFRQAMGTPKPIQAKVWVNRPETQPKAAPDMKSIALQILSLTKLNWASTDSFCGEPITLKYAGDIAYLTAAFLRQNKGMFKLHPVLEKTPWFL